MKIISKLFHSKTLKKRLWIFSFISFGGLFVSLITAVFVYSYIFVGLPSPYSLKDYKAVPISSQIYDRNGQLLYEVYRDENRTPVKLTTLPKQLIEATIAVEDKDFYKHGGISLISGMLRAIKENLQSSRLQGGSTITQQLVKSALLTPERTIQRKIKEIILAIWVEQIFSKDEILEMYLNQVPYGGSSYGIGQAAKTYYEKTPDELELHEAALLAGLPQAPTTYSPHTNPDRAKARRDNVLRRMYEEEYITEQQMDAAMKKPIEVLPPRTKIKAPHFVFEVKKLLEQEYGLKQLEEGGLKVTTTLDLEIQEETEKIVQEEIEDIARLKVTNGAVLVTRPPTGEILAMVGSVNYFDGGSGAFNVTTAGTRQPGSSIKPINYAVGIERGIVTASTMFLDVPTCFSNPGQPKAYCPKNYDGSFHGPVQLRYALANSYNIPAVKMLAFNGVKNFIASSSAFLITSFKNPSQYGLKTGKTIYELKDYNFVQDVKEPIDRPNYLSMKAEKAISEGTAFIISHILSDNNARSSAFGTNSELVIKDKTVSVKTGTTNDLRDNWTIGYTPNFAVTVWVGNNDFTPMAQGIASGLTGASPIWNRTMTYILENQPDLPPVKPSSVIGMQVCSDTGVIAGKQEGGYNCPTRFEYLIQGTNSTANVYRKQVPVNRDTDQYLPDPNNPAIEMREKTVIKDMFGEYCVDCNHEGETRQTVTVQ
ncbi:MAG: Penicillin-binding protein, 1A family [Candidatus Roizmanbacteria bacterium GW2011_GWA2_37_7]|uniref:Penicillin-binding protein, 1A family n=1 Tax=Candidatus Roizmanbacteria bacterium GW2011_GWA2_37_7 TaxID=1618481 RepID=A0A0G0JPF1_9BACT|nr:MAG: Penicillin-binding protein, 1A family [Candidatus Roizmanbacteria bacterium GW2011_GWA2_37_7]